eukprot:Nk52_evm17s1178 gene=Nk52_evmTU17s1178
MDKEFEMKLQGGSSPTVSPFSSPKKKVPATELGPGFRSPRRPDQFLLKSPVKSPTQRYGDRYIPSRASSNLAKKFALLSEVNNLPNGLCGGGGSGGIFGTGSTAGGANNNNNQTNNNNTNGNGSNPSDGAAGGSNNPSGESKRDEPGKLTYSLLLQNELLGSDTVDMLTDGPSQSQVLRSPERNILSYQNSSCSMLESTGRSPSNTNSPFSLSMVGENSQKLLRSPRKTPRKISKTPFKVLDAPELQDDFYLNLVDWSSLNVLSVGLGSCVYLWSACTSQVTKLCDLKPNDTVTSVSWIQRGTHLAVGSNKGEVQIWDVSKGKRVRTMSGHSSRVGTLAWNAHILASGSRDRSIYLRDVRIPEQYVSKLTGHKQEVCGLKWSPDEQQLASGGNDNKLFVWNPSHSSPILRFSEHSAAVKAIAWSPHQHGLLASGGGTADRCIRFWNTLTNQALQVIDTGSQVCNLAWSKNANELVSTHGYSQNQIVVWKYPSMTQVATLTGHTFRVLYLAMSPDGQTVVTGAGDETLRFWNVFSKTRSNKDSKSVLNMFSHIR